MKMFGLIQRHWDRVRLACINNPWDRMRLACISAQLINNQTLKFDAGSAEPPKATAGVYDSNEVAIVFGSSASTFS